MLRLLRMETHGDMPSALGRLTPHASARTQALFAGLMWLAIAATLGWRAEEWLADSHWWIALLATAVTIGVLKARFLLDAVAGATVERTRERGREQCAGGFMSWKSWLFVVGMMAGGIALRHSGLPREFLGTLYAAVATGMLVASRIYWRAALMQS